MLTTAQLQTVKAAVQADPTASAYLAAGNITALTAWLNADSTTDVWRTTMSTSDMVACYDWTELASLTDPQYRRLTLVTQADSIKPSDANVRAMLAAVFAGAGFANTRAALLAKAVRKASRVEAMFATGAGATKDLVVVGPVSEAEVSMLPSA